MAGIKYKTYDIAPRNWVQGANEALTFDIDAPKIRSINVILFNQAGTYTYLLPTPPLNVTSGNYDATYVVSVHINKNNKLIFSFGGAWVSYGARVTIGYVD